MIGSYRSGQSNLNQLESRIRKLESFSRNRRIGQRRIRPTAVRSRLIREEGVASSKISYAARERSAVVTTGKASTSDEYTDIQKAIDFVDSKGGGTVFVKAGTYTIENNISLPSNVRLVGEDSTSTIFDFNEQAYSVDAIGTSTSHLSNISIENISFINGYSTLTNDYNFDDADRGTVNFIYCDDFLISRCDFSGNTGAISGGYYYGADTYCYGCLRGVVERCYSTDSGLCPMVIESSQVTVEKNHYTNVVNFYSATATLDVNYALIQGNFYEGDILEGICSLSGNTIVVSNMFSETEGHTWCIHVTGTNNTVSNNLIYLSSDANDVYYFILATNADNCAFSSNTSYGATNYPSFGGIVLSNVDNSVIVGNVTNGGDQGCSINNTSDRVSIVANVFLDAATANFTNNGTNTQTAGNITA